MGGKQPGFPDYELTTVNKQTKLEKFLSEMEVVGPWLVERELRSMAASLYNQAVKDPYVGETRSPQQWLKEEEAKLRIEPMIEDLKAVGARVEVLAYEPAESLVQRLLKVAGAIDGELPDQIPWTNTSMSAALLMAMLEVNRTVLDPQERIDRRNELVKTIRPAFMPSGPDLLELMG
ncbi:hypothetical protein OGCDGJMD_02407 [Cyanobium usitatum str. Tous]|uniref:hypothetical protein n=1 Tax=Cyanobium usitatum TaxID=2304190 RepID=UPI002AD22394|nr:hypothetical protein [Cyanobium usitatum]CAK6698196.1 hypothetical protein OGCDGJMD_02407 [Cyanobium usitatum str. Tous]